jgi:hypothetical protein
MVRAAAPEILAFPGVEHPSPSRSPALKDALGNAAGGPGQADLDVACVCDPTVERMRTYLLARPLGRRRRGRPAVVVATKHPAGSGGRVMNGSRAVPYDRGAAAIAPDRKTFRQLVGEVGVALAQGDPIAYRYLRLLRFALANGIALALIGAAAGQGRVGMIVTCRADLGFQGGAEAGRPPSPPTSRRSCRPGGGACQKDTALSS